MLPIGADRDSFDELCHGNDPLRLVLGYVQAADRSVDDVGREELRAGRRHREHVRRASVGRHRADHAPAAKIHEQYGAADLRRHGEHRVAGEECHAVRAPVLPEIDRARDSESRQVDDGDAITRSLTRSVIAHDSPHPVVGRRHLMRCFAGGERGKNASRGGIDHRGGIVAHIARDDGSVRRLARGNAHRGREHERKKWDFHGGKCGAAQRDFQPRRSKGFVSPYKISIRAMTSPSRIPSTLSIPSTTSPKIE